MKAFVSAACLAVTVVFSPAGAATIIGNLGEARVAGSAFGSVADSGNAVGFTMPGQPDPTDWHEPFAPATTASFAWRGVDTSPSGLATFEGYLFDGQTRLRYNGLAATGEAVGAAPVPLPAGWELLLGRAGGARRGPPARPIGVSASDRA
jgi:hypothetical protein